MTKSAKKSSNISFADLSLDPQVLTAVNSLGYITPTEVQALAIPAMLKGRDILGVSQTGTGKTAAFALPLLSKLDINSKAVQVLCLTPTRELAIQVASAFENYAKNLKGVKTLAIYGGASYNTQIKSLDKGVQIVVGTPGRMMDLIERKKLKLNQVQAVILDEADEMLKMGFIDDVKWILSHTPKEKQSVLFSATMPKPIRLISNEYLKNPFEITIKNQDNSTKNIAQKYILLNNKDKLKVLKHLLEINTTDGVIIFNRTKRGTIEVAEFLQRYGYKAEALNGDIAQEHREQIINKLKNGVIDIITATDVAARGIDVKRMSHVINFDMADDVSTYVHRIGRVGRAGRSGEAIVFLPHRQKRLLKEIERVTKNTIKEYDFPSVKTINNTKVFKLFERINNIHPSKIEDYLSLVEKYLKQHPQADLAELVAKVLYLEHQEQPFYTTHALEISEEKPSRKTGKPRKRDNRNSRPNRRNTNKEGQRPKRRRR
jgi:ATP-dependent RNA helicase DeaD